MRNLKKVLSLALAMVMLLGMMVVGAGAATEFKDASDIDDSRKVAAAVAGAIEVLIGDENGNFNPTKTLTRAEAAVILTRLDLGADAAKALTATDASTFDDVGTGYGWAKAYIDYCAGNGYMIGVGDNKFAPARTLQAVEFATMLNRVLGYRDSNEYGDGWTAVKAAALARKAGLGTDVAVDSNEITRADMAQMVLNALTAPMVEYEGLNITIGDATFNSQAKVRTHTGSATAGQQNYTYDGETIYSNITPIRLCEEKFPTLKLSRQDEVDSFGRRCSVWKYRGLKIAGSESTITPDLSYNTKITRTMPEWAKMEGYTAGSNLQLWINGQKYQNGTSNPLPEVKDDDDKVITAGTQGWITSYTGAGREVEVYMSKSDLSKVERVVVVDTVLATVSKVNSDGTISVKLEKTANNTVAEGGRVLVAEEGTYEDVKAGDVVLVQGYGKARIGKDTTISSVVLAPQENGFVNIKRYNKEKGTVLVMDSTEYPDAYSVVEDYDVNSFNVNTKYDSKLILDTHGNIMKAIEGMDAKAVTDKLIAVKRTYSALSGGEIVKMVEGVLSNGVTVDWPVTKGTDVGDNTICQWNLLESGKYEVKAVEKRTYNEYRTDWTGDTTTKKTNAGKTYSTHVANVDATGVEFKANDVFGKDYAGSVMYSDTVKFIFVDSGENGGVTILNGRQNYTLPEGANIVAQAMKGNEIIAVFVNAEPDVIDISDLIYVHSLYRLNDTVVTLDDGSRVQYYGYKAYNSNGEEIEGFLGQRDNMANKFHKAEKTDDGKAYKPANEKKAVQNHTIVSGVVAKANGLTGDSFVLVDKGANGVLDKTDNHYDFMGRKSTKVIDLTGEKYYADSIADLNEIVNDGNYVEVAVIFNETDATAKEPSVEKVREAVTVFVTKISKDSKDTALVPDHEVVDPDAPEKFTVTIKDVTGVKITVTDKDGKAVASGTKVEEGTVLTVEAKATDTKKHTSLTVDGEVYTEVTLKVTKAVEISATAPTDKPAGPSVDTNLVIGEVTEGYKITKAHVITAEENGDTDSPYNGLGAGKLYLEYTVPAGATIDTGAAPTVSLKAGVMTYAVNMGHNTAVSGEALTYSSVSSAALPTFTGTGTLDFTAAAVTGYAVKYDLSAVPGYGLTGGSGKTDESKLATSSALNFTLSGFPTYMKEAKVVYTVTGLTGDQEATLTLGTSKKVTTTAFATDKDVDVVVKSITPTIVNATVSGLEGATSSLTAGGVTMGAKGAIGTITLPSWPTGATGKVSYKITGMTTDDETNAPLEGTVEGVNGTTVTLPAGNHYTPEGNKAVNIEITGIEYTQVTGANAIRIIADGALDSQAYTSFAVTGSTIALTKNGNSYTNTSNIVVTLTYGVFTTAGKTAAVTFANSSVYSGGPITTSATVADTTTNSVTFTIAAGSLTIDPAGQAIAILVTPNA